MTYYCWRCSRRLDVVCAPVHETATILCQRCKARNVVRDGHDPAEEISGALDTPPSLVFQSQLTTS